MTFTLGLLVVVHALIIPLTGHVNTLVGSAIGWVVVFAALVIGWNLASRHISAYPLLRALDLYLFVCFAMAIVWYTMWALDTSGSKNEQVSVPIEPDASHFFAYLVISYNMVGSFWFIGPARMTIGPVSTAAYVWGFAVSIVGIWRIFSVLTMIVHAAVILKQQQQRQEDPLASMENGQSEFISSQQQPQQPVFPMPMPMPPVASMPVPSYRVKYSATLPQPHQQHVHPPMSIAALRHLQEMSKMATANLTMATTPIPPSQPYSVVAVPVGTLGTQKPKDA